MRVCIAIVLVCSFVYTSVSFHTAINVGVPFNAAVVADMPVYWAVNTAVDVVVVIIIVAGIVAVVKVVVIIYCSNGTAITA